MNEVARSVTSSAILEAERNCAKYLPLAVFLFLFFLLAGQMVLASDNQSTQRRNTLLDKLTPSTRSPMSQSLSLVEHNSELKFIFQH